MKKITKYSWLIPLTAWGMCLSSCISEPDVQVESPNGVRAYAEITLERDVTVETRATKNNYDGWSVSTFNDPQTDVAGMYAIRGRQSQHPDSLDSFVWPVVNSEMFYEGTNGPNSYRFGNSTFTLDPSTVASYPAIMYYPYYKDMPEPWDSATLPGLPIRKTDTDGIEKCIDFMYNNNWTISTSNNVLSPYFYHYFVNLIVQRGEGFENAPVRDIWIVMKNPCTDIRIRRAYGPSNTASYYFYYTLQYSPSLVQVGDESIDLMDEVRKVDTNAAALPEDEQPHYMVNKHAVWKTWSGSSYKAKDSKYAMIPPGYGNYLNSTSTGVRWTTMGEIFFILIQDDHGNWQRVTDFYLYGTGQRYGQSGQRYCLTIQLEGVNVVARPSLVSWEDEVEVTDVHKVGISSYEEYNNWVAQYNLYTSNNRSESETMIEALKAYGDGVKDESGRMNWTFYINDDIVFPDNASDFAPLWRLDDQLEGTSTYTTYSISNVHRPLIKTIGEHGVLRALEFRNVRLVQPTTDAAEGTPYAAITEELAGGKIEQCNVVNGVLVTPNEVGMIAGKVTNGGTVSDCTITGNIYGKSTADGFNGLFGTVEGTVQPTASNNRYGGLHFIEY